MVKFESEKLLEEFARSRSEEAFVRVVEEHSGLVLGVARRKVGSRAEAEDVMQEVFVMLAKKAGTLVKGKVSVSGWLYRQSCRLAANRVRGEVRRRRREEEFGAVMETEPGTVMMEEIDEALGQLTEKERELVICRYVEERDYAEMGRRFGVTSEAARKRVGRAVEKLRVVLEKRGVEISASGLALALLGLGGPRASAAVVAQVSGMALKSGVSAGGGIFSGVGILAGVMGVSVVMGGVRMMEGEERVMGPVPVVVSGRAIRGEESILSRIGHSRNKEIVLRDEDIWRLLDELDGEPMTLVTDLLLADITKSISGDRIFEFIDGADKNVSVRMKERLCFILGSRALEQCPVEVMDGFLDRVLMKMKNPDQRRFSDKDVLGFQLVSKWGAVAPAEASSWVAENLEQLDRLGEAIYSPVMYSGRRRVIHRFSRGQFLFSDTLLQNVGQQIFDRDGFGGVERFVSRFDDERAAIIWKPIFYWPQTLWGDEFYPVEFAEKLASFPNDIAFGELKEVVWRKWYRKWASELRDREGEVTLVEYMQALPVHLGVDFRKSCLDEIVKDGEGAGE